jgi:hypothetical protein
MDNDNYEYLTGQLKSLGFGEKKKYEIKAAMENGNPSFQIPVQGEFKRPDGKMDKVEYVLHFEKPDNSERYFLNRYDAVLEKNELRNENVEKTFYVKGFNKEFPEIKQNITYKEAYNLLDGRAVLKDRIKKDKTNGTASQYMAWQYLDFSQKDDRNQPVSSQYHASFYDLNEVIKAYPIKGKENDMVMNDLFYNLEKGNLTRTTFSVDGKDEIKYITARPLYKNLDVFNENLVNEKQHQQHREPRTRIKPKEEVKPEVEASKKKSQKARR